MANIGYEKEIDSALQDEFIGISVYEDRETKNKFISPKYVQQRIHI